MGTTNLKKRAMPSVGGEASHVGSGRRHRAEVLIPPRNSFLHPALGTSEDNSPMTSRRPGVPIALLLTAVSRANRPEVSPLVLTVRGHQEVNARGLLARAVPSSARGSQGDPKAYRAVEERLVWGWFPSQSHPVAVSMMSALW